jgi:hypothetical protein
MACAALTDRGIEFPQIFDYVKICPQMFFIDGFDLHFYDSYVRNTPLQDDLRKASGQALSTYVEDVARGRPVTWMTADYIRDFLASRGHASIRNVVSVTEAPRKPKPLKDERAVYDLALYDLDPLVHEPVGNEDASTS